jgi:RNA polymerase sigma-70 factor (ECF subfamily)
VPEERRIYWVVTVTKNAALDLLRKERRDLPMDEEVQRQVPAVPAEEGGFRALVEIIRQMPDIYRRVLELRFLTEWSHAEIARELHISEGAVKTRVARGRQMLIESMRKEGYVCE